MTGVRAWRRRIGYSGAEPGREVHEYGLDNGRTRIAVWDYGATLVDVVTAGDDGVPVALLVRLPGLAAYEQQAGRMYIGSTMGRYARIVANGTAPIDGRVHRLARNEGAHHIHGGPRGFDARVWSGTAEDGAGTGRIVLTLRSLHGDQGYPGEMHVTATFELTVGDQMVVTYEAVTDQPTLCGLTLHAFWNLAGTGPVDGHLLELGAGSLIEADEDFVPSGRLLPVDGTCWDFRTPRVLGATVFDHCLALRAATPSAANAAGEPESRTICLRDNVSGRTLLLSTDQPAVAVYTGDYLPTPRAGICLQPGPWPDAPNHPSFPSAVLRPGETYRSRTTYAFSREK